MPNTASFYFKISASFLFAALLASMQFMHAQDTSNTKENNPHFFAIDPRALAVLIIACFAFSGTSAAASIYFFQHEEKKSSPQHGTSVDSIVHSKAKKN